MTLLKQGMKGEKVSSICYSKNSREYRLEEHPKEEESTRGEINGYEDVKSGIDSKRERLGSSVKHETLNSRDRNRRRDVAIHHRRNEFIFV